MTLRLALRFPFRTTMALLGRVVVMIAVTVLLWLLIL